MSAICSFLTSGCVVAVVGSAFWVLAFCAGKAQLPLALEDIKLYSRALLQCAGVETMGERLRFELARCAAPPTSAKRKNDPSANVTHLLHSSRALLQDRERKSEHFCIPSCRGLGRICRSRAGTPGTPGYTRVARGTVNFLPHRMTRPRATNAAAPCGCNTIILLSARRDTAS